MLKPQTHVVLRDERTGSDRRSLTACIGPQDDVIVEGHDLGGGVDSLLGFREYEWTLTIAAADTRTLWQALNGGRVLFAALRRRRRLLDALRRRFSGDRADSLEPFLKEHGIPYSLWNRIGD